MLPPKASPQLRPQVQEKCLIFFRHLTCQKMQSPGFNYQLYSPINCLSIANILEYLSIKLNKGKIKAFQLLSSSSSPTTARIMLFARFIKLSLPNKVYCFTVQMICVFQVNTQSQRYPIDRNLLLMILTLLAPIS